MKVDVKVVEEILNKLPIGYYIGKEVKASLDMKAPTSYYDIINEHIYLSYPLVCEALDKIDRELTFEQVECIIRSIFYHEVSHAMLTPKKFKNNPQRNIFEDERMERKLDGFYYGVNFKKLVRILNNEHEEKTGNINRFFDLVRFRKGPEKFLKRVDTLIKKYENINSMSTYWEVNNYLDDIDRLYEDFCEDDDEDSFGSGVKSDKDDWSMDPFEDFFNDLFGGSDKDEDKDDEDKASSDGRDSEEEDEKEDVSSGSSTSGTPGKGTESGPTPEPKSGNPAPKSFDDFDEDDEDVKVTPMTKEEMERITRSFKEMTTIYYNDKLLTELTRIFNSANKANKSTGSAINTYSGVFDPRSVIRDDYKYFLQKNRAGNRKAYSKIHLNLFIDCSGSFSSSVDETNELIQCLSIIERKFDDFSFELITCGMGEYIQPKKNILFDASGGNRLDREIFKIFKKVQRSNAMNYNIVLFDGDANTDNEIHDDDHNDGGKANFAAFNTQNTLIISDPSNQSRIHKYAPNARSIFTKNYSKELQKNIIEMLDILVR